MYKKWVSVMLASVMVLSLSACQSSPVSGENKESTEISSIEETENTQQTEAGNKGVWDAASKVQEDKDAQNEQELYNTYIEVNNFMIGRLNDSLIRYFDYVKLQEEFEPYDADYDCYSIMSSLFTYLEDANTMASAKSQKDELDNAFLAMYPSIKQVMTTLNEIYDYTDMKSYLDDDYAKGKEYHAILWTAFNEYQTTGDVFMEELGKVADEHNAQFLEEMKAEGLEVLYSINMVMNSAQAIEEELYNEGISDENVIEMNLEVVQPLYDEFVKNVELVMEYSKDDEKLQEEGVPINTASWNFFLDSMKKTKTSMTEILQHVKDQEPLSYSDTLITMAGNTSIASFETGISDMIDNYNSLISYY